MATSLAALIGSIVGAVLFIGLISLIVWLYISRCKKSSNKDSETGSSDLPAAVETGPFIARQFKIEELEQATRQFHESNLIGIGSFGLVYKGLLCDGTVVAIKKRVGHPRSEFVREVAYLSSIRHRNLVTLLGYCQENGSQLLVFEFLPNGSMSNHLHGKDTTTKLEFKQRLSIASGAARGLAHLHGLQPPVMHRNFKTANVLVDENFIPKVADAGLSKLLENIEGAASSGSSSFNAYRDPELELQDTFTETNDTYSFGIFILELASGKEAADREAFQSNDSIIQWVREQLSSNELVDQRMSGSFTAEGMRDFIRLMLKCMSFPGKDRPIMENVVIELDQILETEITRTTVMGEGTTTVSVTLGSELFTN